MKLRILSITGAAAAAIIFSGCTGGVTGASDTNTDTHSTAEISQGTEIPDIPSTIPSQIKSYTGYTVSYNKSTGNPNWAAWELTRAETGGGTSRKEADFWQDTGIEGCHTSKEYVRSGYDRGHMCPAADMKWSADAMKDCFSMANIAPQDRSLNSGAWNTLEKKCRVWADRDSALLIVAGPIYDKGFMRSIANSSIQVPSAFFKVIIAPYIDSPRGIAFVYPNTPAPGNMNNYAMSIDEVEKMTGYNFFHSLPDELEDNIESMCNFKAWDSK